MRDVFLVFEGGGAKAVSSVGAVRAVELDGDFSIRGCAGTSAGAIVASLVASGYRSDELFRYDKEKQTTHSVFDLLPEDTNRPPDLLAPRHWKRLARARKLFRKPKPFWLLWGLISLVVLLAPLFDLFVPDGTCATYLWSNICWITQKSVWFAYAFGVVVAVTTAGAFLLNIQGFASLDRLAEKLNYLLCQKVSPRDGKNVTFGDFRRSGKILKIVASNVGSMQLRLFSTENPDCSDIRVADAVAASSAIPLLFRPVTIGGEQYVDGGMVSNLPAWTFDEQLVNDDRCWTITSESIPPSGIVGPIKGDDLHGSKPLKGIRLLRNIAVTGLFGASDLNTRGIAHHLRFPIPVDLGLLDFDVTNLKVAAEVRKASTLCLGLIEARNQEIEFLERVHDEANDSICRTLEISSGLGLRTALVREIRLTGSEVAGYHLWASKGFEGCPDENLKLTRTGTLIDECLSAAPDGATADLETVEGRERFFRVGREGFLRSVTPVDRKWSMVFPLAVTGQHYSGLGRVSVAITFDGASSVSAKFNDVRKLLKDLSDQWKVG